MRDVDVLILGAGPAGCATALALRQAGVERVLMVDKPQRLPFRVGESATPDVVALLERVGAEADLAAQGHLPHHATVSLWGGPAEIDDYLRKGQGHGWHLDRAAFDEQLRRQAQQRGAHLLSPGSIKAVSRDDESWLVDLGEWGVARARVLVDAAGRRAPLATRLGVTRRSIDEMVALAVIAEPAAEPPLTGLSVVEPCADGWWYAAPLPSGRAIVMLLTDADIAQEQGLRDAATFRRRWDNTTELRRRVPPPSSIEVASFAAHSGFIDRAAGPGWLAVGDALLGFDPLTSSGLSGALNDAVAAAETIGVWLEGSDPAPAGRAYGQRANGTLSRYLRERRDRYGWERRWEERPFWARRQGRG